MPRRRNISPGLTENEYLAEASIPARFLFAMLPCWADREGRLKERLKQIKHGVFPWDDIDVEPLLEELENLVDDEGKPAGFIHRYRDGKGQRIIQIIHFREHQNPHRNETASVLEPSLDIPRTDQGMSKDLPRTDLVPTKDSTAPADPNQDLDPDPNPRSKGGSDLEPHLAQDVLNSIKTKTPTEPSAVFAREAVLAAEVSEVWLPWFVEVGGMLIDKGATCELRDMLKNMMDSKDPEKRQAKGIGELRVPLAFIKKQLTDMLKANGIRKWPNFPKEA